MTTANSSSRRSLLAALWSIVGILTLASFVVAIVFANASKQYYDYGEAADGDENYYNYNSGDGGQNQQQQRHAGQSAISVTSRAMVFAAIWTAVLSGILVIFGTVILGIRMPTGKYYACCAGNVHRMTPLSLGVFGGSLLMFANLTLVCAILFGEFEIRDFNFGVSRQQENEEENGNNNNNNGNDGNYYDVVDQSSFAFSIMCVFFTVMYAAFAALIFYNSNSLLDESVADARDEFMMPPGGRPADGANSAPGYIGGDRFGVVGRTYGKGTKSIEVL